MNNHKSVITGIASLGSLLQGQQSKIARNLSLDTPSLVEASVSTHMKSFVMYESTVDLLALSVCWRRLRNDTSSDPKPYITSLLDIGLLPQVSDTDIELANSIRDYYSKKLMMLSLKSERPFTQFKKDLSTFVNSDGTIFREEFVPLVFRLPEFYDYDIQLDKFITESKQDFVLGKDEYKFLGNMVRINRKMKKHDYWFVDSNKALGCVSIDTHNNLLGFWDTQVHNNSTGVIKLLGKKQRRIRDDLVYFSIVP
jgi:hypothetical protein